MNIFEPEGGIFDSASGVKFPHPTLGVTVYLVKLRELTKWRLVARITDKLSILISYSQHNTCSLLELKDDISILSIYLSLMT